MFDSLFSERGLSLERLRVLIEVDEAGSIARTAPGDAVRHSQYSRQLRELSEFFGCELTHRQGKVLKLTAEGAGLAVLLRTFLRGLEDYRSECKRERIVFNIAAGDSLIHWLVMPRLGSLMKRIPEVRFTTRNLTTNEIVQQISDARVDFGLIRKNALNAGMKYASLGALSYVAVVPVALVSRKRPPSFSQVFNEFPLAMQSTDGQFTKQLRHIALSQNASFLPALACQSFPQTVAAVRSGQFAAIVPELSVQELPSGFVYKIADNALRELHRDIILAWNPRIMKIRPHAAKIAAQMQTTFRFC
jgi:DNA-binding transcriptional LysR family regulator